MWFGPGYVGAWHKRYVDDRTQCGIHLPPPEAVTMVGFDAEDMAVTKRGEHEHYCPICIPVAPARRVDALMRRG